MIIIYIAIYTIINIYIFWDIIKWVGKANEKLNTKLFKIIIGTIYFCVFITPILGFFMPLSGFQKNIQKFACYFLGLVIYMLLMFIPIDIIKIIAVKIFKVDKDFFNSKKFIYSIGLGCFIIVTITFFYGTYNAQNITVREYNVKINKTAKDIDHLKIALIADMHLGFSVGSDMMEQMAEKVNNQNPDIVFIAGDIFDNSTHTVDDLERCRKAISSIKSKYGVYATFGNHDIEERLFSGFSVSDSKSDYRTDEMERFIKDSGIKILDDEVIKLFSDSVYIIGRKDAEKPGFGDEKRKDIKEMTENVDFKKPVIVVEHEPRSLNNISNLGVDLHLAGHTHAGQFFPLTVGTALMWKNSYGMKKINDMTSIVTSGIGIYGPNIRVGTKSEISMVNVNFEK